MLRNILTCIEGQLAHLLSSVSFGTETSPEDFVSKALHAGMLDNLAMEIADIAQISAMNMPKGESNSPIIAIGLETVDTSKPVILIIGHNSSVAHEIGIFGCPEEKESLLPPIPLWRGTKGEVRSQGSGIKNEKSCRGIS